MSKISAMNVCLYFCKFVLFNVLLCGCLYPVVVKVQKQDSYKNDTFIIDISLQPREMIYKDSIKISFSHPQISVNSWKTSIEPQEEYIAAFKLHKKVYKQSFSIFVVASNLKEIKKDVKVDISCFIVTQDEQVVPFVTQLMVLEEKDFNVSQKTLRSIRQYRLLWQGAQEKLYNNPLWRIESIWFLVGLLFLIFIVFIIVDVLLLPDVGILLCIGGWSYLVRLWVPYVLFLFLTAALLLWSAIWFLKNKNKGGFFLRKTRLTLGFLCAFCVLPICTEAYLIWWFM